MKIILLQDVKSLGQKGDIKDVSEGYARNFLLPKKMAEMATEEAVKNIMVKKEKEKAESAKNAEKMRELAGVLKDREIVLKSKEKDGKLFGSISSKDIAKKLGDAGFDINSQKIILGNPIRKVGKYAVEIKLSQEISTRIQLKVEGE